MNYHTKIILKIFLIVGLGGAIGYGAYKLYHYIIEDATNRIKKGVAQGVSKGIGGIFNPLKW